MPGFSPTHRAPGLRGAVGLGLDRAQHTRRALSVQVRIRWWWRGRRIGIARLCPWHRRPFMHRRPEVKFKKITLGALAAAALARLALGRLAPVPRIELGIPLVGAPGLAPPADVHPPRRM